MNTISVAAVLAAMCLCVRLIRRSALTDAGSPAEATSQIFIATLLTLAVLEHWFLVLPIPAETLWAWGMNSRRRGEVATSA